MANVLAFLSGHSRRDWSQQELAEFYRVERALAQAGLSVLTDRGLSDEGDPWFAFCRAEDGEVVVHFARIDGQYIVAGPAYDGIVCGVDIRSIAISLVDRHPLMQRRIPQRDNVVLHPAALLVAIVAVALLKSSEAQAHNSDVPLFAAGRIRDASPEAEGHRSESVHSAVLDARHVATVISAAMIAMSLASDSQQSAHNEIADLALPSELNSDGSTSDSLIFAFPASSRFEERAVAENTSNFDDSSDVGGPPSLSGEQTLELLSFITVLNDVAGPVMQAGDAFQVQTISEIFGPAVGNALAVAFASSPVGLETLPAEPAALIEVEMDVPGAFPAVQSLTFIGTDEVSYTGEFEIVSALPSNLQPYLAEGLTLEAASTSAGDVLMALNADPGAMLNGEPVAEAVEPAVHSVGEASFSFSPTETLDSDIVLKSSASGVALETIVDYIGDFIAHADRFKVICSDGDVVFYDVRAVKSGDPTLDSITWEFADGTSISLIGSAADLPYDLAA
jgi:hypothetical protein